MSQPPLNEDKAHVIRTPNFNLPGKLGFMNPAGQSIKYSTQVGEREDAPIPLAEGMNPWHAS